MKHLLSVKVKLYALEMRKKEIMDNPKLSLRQKVILGTQIHQKRMKLLR